MVPFSQKDIFIPVSTIRYAATGAISKLRGKSAEKDGLEPEVALKVIGRNRADLEEKYIDREFQAHKICDHENVIKAFGACLLV